MELSAKGTIKFIFPLDSLEELSPRISFPSSPYRSLSFFLLRFYDVYISAEYFSPLLIRFFILSPKRSGASLNFQISSTWNGKEEDDRKIFRIHKNIMRSYSFGFSSITWSTTLAHTHVYCWKINKNIIFITQQYQLQQQPEWEWNSRRMKQAVTTFTPALEKNSRVLIKICDHNFIFLVVAEKGTKPSSVDRLIHITSVYARRLSQTISYHSVTLIFYSTHRVRSETSHTSSDYIW